MHSITPVLICRPPGPLVFPLRRRNHRRHACAQPSVVVPILQTRCDFIINNPDAERIGQDSFHTIARLNGHFPVLNKNKKHRSVILALLTSPPGPCHANRVIINGRIRFHPRKHRHQNLAGSLLLKILQGLVQPAGCSRRHHARVIIEIVCRCGWNGLHRRSPETPEQTDDDIQSLHESLFVRRRRGLAAKVEFHLRRRFRARRGIEIRLLREPS